MDNDVLESQDFLNFVNDDCEDSLPQLNDVHAMDECELDALPKTTKKQMYEHGKYFEEFLQRTKLTAVTLLTANIILNDYLRFF